MRFSIATAALLATSAYASADIDITKRGELDLVAVCNQMTTQEGDCHFVITTGLDVVPGGPVTGAPIPVVGAGWAEGARTGSLFDNQCNLLESKEWTANGNGNGWSIEFIENEAHDYIHAYEGYFGDADLDAPDMSTGLTNPLVPICGPKKSQAFGLDVSWYRVCVFHCTGGLQQTS